MSSPFIFFFWKEKNIVLKSEFKNLQIGDVVIITSHGKNRGKMGIVREIRRRPQYGGIAYLEPLNCEFEFSNIQTRQQNKDGFYWWQHTNIRYPEKDSKKKFYVSVFFETAVSWPTTNFNQKELAVIERYLKELTEHTKNSVLIKSIGIADDNQLNLK